MKRLVVVGLLLTSPLFARSTDVSELAMITAIRASQNAMASGAFAEAEACLVEYERINPNARDSPQFCSQRFFVALNGLGNRSRAREFLTRLTAQVQAGRLSADSAEFQAVTAAWYREMQFTDSDLPRQAAQKLTQRVAQTSGSLTAP